MVMNLLTKCTCYYLSDITVTFLNSFTHKAAAETNWNKEQNYIIHHMYANLHAAQLCAFTMLCVKFLHECKDRS